jgi:hypothetical protein
VSDQQPSKDIPFFQLIYLLLFNPQVFDLLPSKSVVRSFAHVLLVAGISSIVISVSYRSELAESAKKWETFLNSEVGEFGYDEAGKLYWKQPGELPYTAHVGDWRIEFETTPLDEARARRGVARKGVWITRDGITIWDWIEFESLFKPREEMLRTRSLEQMFPTLWSKGPKELKSTEEIARVVDMGRLELLVQIGRNTFLSIFVLLAVLSFFFSLLYLFSLGNRDSRFRRTMPKLLVIYLHTCIPPIIVATIYEALHVPMLTFFAVFCIAFFIYHMYVMRHFRRESLLE